MSRYVAFWPFLTLIYISIQLQVAFLTNDLTEPVLDEALSASADLIISYHPPLFRPFKRLTSKSWKERIAVKCIESRVAVFSPHTSWDAIPGDS